MLALFTAFILFLQQASLISADTPFLPPFKSSAESRPAIIRGLFELEKRQGYYYCPAPRFTCESYYCCPNRNYQCCRDGGCCWPGTYCAVASNGNIGCCPTGKLCSGPVGDPSTTTIYYTSTHTHTDTINIPRTTTTPIATRSTTPAADPPTIVPTTTPRTTTTPFVPSLGAPTFPSSPAPNSANATSTSPLAQPAFTAGLTNAATGRIRSAGFFIAISTWFCLVFTMTI